MTLLIILLGIVACILNVLMDEVDHKYERFFGKIVPDKLDWWFNPAISHVNKWWANSWILDKLFSTVLVWTTDFWHFAKTIMLACIGLIIVLLENNSLCWWQYGIEVLVLSLGWFLVWEFINGIIGAMSDKLKNNTK